MTGYIKLYRQLLQSPTFDNPNLLKVFIYCLLKASHCEHTQVVGLQNVPLLPGQFIYGRDKAASELNMKPSTLHRYMLCLKSSGNIDIKANNKFSIITVAKWEIFQSEDKNLDSNSDNKWAANEQQMDTNNNDKNANKVIKPKKEKPVYDHKSKPYRCAVFLEKQLCERLPARKPSSEKTLQDWADEFEQTNAKDGYEWELIGNVLEWCTEDSFWKLQIRSGANFRKHFEKMYDKMGGGK